MQHLNARARARLWLGLAACSALALAATTTLARADDQSQSGAAKAATFADLGPYIGAGYVRAQVNNVFGTTNYGFKIDDNAWKAILGFRFIPFFAAEANYVDLGHQSAGRACSAAAVRRPMGPPTPARSICSVWGCCRSVPSTCSARPVGRAGG